MVLMNMFDFSMWQWALTNTRNKKLHERCLTMGREQAYATAPQDTTGATATVAESGLKKVKRIRLLIKFLRRRRYCLGS